MWECGHTMIKNIYRSIIFLVFISYIQLGAEGIIAGTLVVTPQGLQCIEELNVGDIVTCYDFRTSRSTQQKITHINNHISNHLIQLTINDDVLFVDVHQRVYLPIEQRWCQAKNLSPGNIILASVDNILHYLVLDDVQVVDDAYDIYELTVPVYHNFYISKYGVITHNVMVFDDIAIASLPPVLTFAATTVATIATKIMTVLSFLCATPVALTSTQATVAAAATAISVGGSMLHDSYKARRAQQSSEQKQCETCTPESDSYTIRVHDNLYTCKEKLGMPSMSERVHLNLGPDKPGPACPSHNPTKTVTYYDAAGKLLIGQELAMVKKQDLARRQAEKAWQLLRSAVPTQQLSAMPNICPAPADTKETKQTVCDTVQQTLPSISTCPPATDTKEPTSACGLQQADVPAPPKQPCSLTHASEQQLSLRDTTVVVTAPSNPKTGVEETKTVAPVPKHPNGRYEDAGYHKGYQSGQKSPRPSNGQAALDNSFNIPGKERTRIGTSNNQFVVLNKTSEGLYHGHVRRWQELTQGMKNILNEAGIVTHKGKFIT